MARLRFMLVEGRDCGECSVCCEVLNIDQPELKKEAGTLCPHCTDAGCAVYETRPELCRGWYCLWRRLPDLPDSFRPDRSRILLSFEGVDPPENPFETDFIVIRAVDDPDTNFSPPEITAILDEILEASPYPIWVSSNNGRKYLVHPSTEIATAVINNTPATDADQAREINDWKTGWNRRKAMSRE
ncbi:hypothetical protein NUV25_19815 [Burkholderia pseudomultivorans]|uniref:hypothetical protein n=1 Tax=Burkholderia pseudomultivorans TaxID=1207504 RepID=UPI002876B205|nr:hypothetical protein [Burkholderia pseudomultivorans]MDS0859958.1 hypothetical protein [Burkholderia pseudomultivorans]